MSSDLVCGSGRASQALIGLVLANWGLCILNARRAYNEKSEQTSKGMRLAMLSEGIVRVMLKGLGMRNVSLLRKSNNCLGV